MNNKLIFPLKRERQVMNNPVLEAKIRDTGYVKVPFFSSEEVDEISSFYNSNTNDLGKGYHSTMFSKDSDYRKRVHNFLKAKVTSGINHYLFKYHPVVATFLVKETEGETVVNLHADWCLTDETKYQSLIVWVSLVDTEDNNGALHFLPRSHHYTDKNRGHGLPFEYEKFDRQLLQQREEIVNTKKGEALIFDLSVLHFSGHNNSNIPRLAFNIGLIPDEAPSIHICRHELLDNDLMETYEVGDDFYQHYELNKIPIFANKIGVEKYYVNGVSNSELEQLYSSGLPALP